MTKPAMRERTIAIQIGISILRMKMADRAPTRPTTEPTERSMLPMVRMHKSIPIARIKTYAFCWMRFEILRGLSKTPLVKNSKITTTTINAITMAY